MAVGIRLLGDFAISVGDREVPSDAWTRRQAAALVKLLALAPNRALHRELVIDALWPDLSIQEAAPRLHKAAHFARKVLGEPTSLTVRGDVIALFPDEDVTVDAFRFDEMAETALGKGTVAAAEEAVAHYGGVLLPHDLYEPWTENVRERLRLRHLQLLRQARRWEDLLTLDPADEDAHLALMRARADAGDRRGALLQYDFLERALEHELGVEPSAAATALRDELLAAAPAPPPAIEHASDQVSSRSPLDEAREPAPARTTDAAWPLIGRSSELAMLVAHFEDQTRGGVLLTGDAGMGKTRLADEALRAATAAGVVTARAAGHPGARAVGLAALAHLLPGELLGTSSGDGELERASLFHRARNALTASLQPGQRMLLVIDDVDQLDELSRALVASLVVDRSVFAVLTLRSGGPPLPSIEHLTKDGHLARLELGALDPEAAEVLLHRVLGRPMVAPAIGKLVGASMGNPGILRELVDAARASGALAVANGIWHLDGDLPSTPTLESLVTERLVGVRGETEHAVELLSLAGDLDLEVLISLTSEDAVDDVDRRGLLLVRTEDRRTVVDLAHPLYGESIRARLSPLRSRRLQRELADAVEARGARRRGDEFRVVVWRLEGGGDAEPELLIRTARLALLDGRHDIAERLLRRLPVDHRPPAAVQLLAELHFRRGDAEGADALLAGLDLLTVDDHHRAQIARRRASTQFYRTTDYRPSAALLQDEIALTSDPNARRALEATLAMTWANGGQITRSVELAESILPEASGSTRLELLRALSLALTAAGRSDDAVERAREGRALRSSLDADAMLPGLTMLLFAELVALTQSGAIDEGRRIAEHARRQHLSGTMIWLETARGNLELMAGRPSTARRSLEAVVNDARARGHGPTERHVLALHASTLLVEGDVDSAAVELARVASLEDSHRGLFHPEIDRAHAWLEAARSDHQAACARLMESADDAAQRGARGVEATLLHDAVRFGALDAFDRLGALSITAQGELAPARLRHAAGLVAGDAGLVTQAAEQFADLGAGLPAAFARADLDDMAARRGPWTGGRIDVRHQLASSASDSLSAV